MRGDRVLACMKRILIWASSQEETESLCGGAFELRPWLSREGAPFALSSWCVDFQAHQLSPVLPIHSPQAGIPSAARLLRRSIQHHFWVPRLRSTPTPTGPVHLGFSFNWILTCCVAQGPQTLSSGAALVTSSALWAEASFLVINLQVISTVMAPWAKPRFLY